MLRILIFIMLFLLICLGFVLSVLLSRLTEQERKELEEYDREKNNERQ